MTRDSSHTKRTRGIDRQGRDGGESRASPGSTAPTTGSDKPDKSDDHFDIAPKLADLPVLPQPTVDQLSERQLVDYKAHRERLLLWMLNRGKKPDKGKGYSWDTVRCRAYNTDIFYRWVWDQRDTYTTHVTGADADGYLRELVRSDQSSSNKQNIEKSIKMLFRWREFEFGEDWSEWEPTVSFAEAEGPREPRDYLTRTERGLIRDAAVDHGSVPHYNAVTPEERQRWKEYLAQRFRKPLHEVNKDDFDRANGYKIPSLVCTSLDAGLRPNEVATARVAWIDTENAILRIPYDESVKNEGNWHVSLRDETSEFLARWIEERQFYDKYEETDLLWMTRENNPYRSTALKRLLVDLCDHAGIETENRQLTWSRSDTRWGRIWPARRG